MSLVGAKKCPLVFVLVLLDPILCEFCLPSPSASYPAKRTFAMETRVSKSSLRSAPPASGDEAGRLASDRQSQSGDESASRLSTRMTTTTAAPIDARPSGVPPKRIGSDTTLNRSQHPASTVTTSSYRYAASSHESTTPNFSRLTAGAGASQVRPTSTTSQTENGDYSYFVWARRHDRLTALQSPVRGHDYAAAGIVRSYHRVPSALRSEDDATSSLSPISFLTESDNASASVRWSDPAGALRHATHVVAPSIHSQAGRIGAASISTRREDSVAPISRYNSNTRPRTYSTPVLPLRPTTAGQRPRTLLDMHDQYERSPTYRPQTRQVEWGNNLSPHSTGYTLHEIHQRRAALSKGFPQPHASATEQRIFAGPFVDAPTSLNATSSVNRIATRDTARMEEVRVAEEEEEQPKTPGRWRKMSGLFTKKLARKGKGASPTQISPTASPSTSQSTPSRIDAPPRPMAIVPTTPAASPLATRTREARPLSPLVVPPFRPRPARILIKSRDAEHPPVSPLSEADARQGTEGLSPVSPIGEHPSPSHEERPASSCLPLSTTLNPTKSEEELISCLKAASALPQHHGQASGSSHQSAKGLEDANEERAHDSLRLEQLDQDLFPSPLLVQKRWQRSPSPLSPSQRQLHGRRHQLVPELVGDNAHWGNARSVRVVAKGKGRLVDNSPDGAPPLPERSRPVLSEAPGPSFGAEVGIGADGGDGKERRDTTFASTDVAERMAVGEVEGTGGKKDEVSKSTALSWQTNDSREFVAPSGPSP